MTVNFPSCFMGKTEQASLISVQPSRRQLLKAFAMAGAAVALGVKDNTGPRVLGTYDPVTKLVSLDLKDHLPVCESKFIESVINAYTEAGFTCKFKPKNNPIQDMWEGRYVFEISAPDLTS
jgi:hypothetical protein